MRFWSLIISSASLFGLVAAAYDGITVAWVASAPATLAFVVLGLCTLIAATCQPTLTPAPAPIPARQRRARG
ncbi:MAG TPA: hypothetical protein VGH03_23305 [Caulobacteraceae bacterium]|jgi:hypothetical protein